MAPALAFGGAAGGSAPAATVAEEPAEAGKRLRAAYSGWRARLERHEVYVGRDLLHRLHSADGSAYAPTQQDLRESIRRMRDRWARWLRSDAGRSHAFRLKVRNRVPGWGRASLRSIAACESRGNPRAVGGGGAYRGLYQFSFSTWRVVGGNGDPAAASRWEQTWRAWLLLSRHGSGHWPVCG